MIAEDMQRIDWLTLNFLLILIIETRISLNKE